MNINGKCKVFAKEFDGRMVYSTSVGRKKQDGTWVNQFVSLKFLENRKIADPQLPDGTMIHVKDGWISCYESKSGIKDEWVIASYEAETDVEDVKLPGGFAMFYGDSDIPF